MVIRKSDEIMLSLVHYFVTKENYTPIQVQGVKDEIWLENLEGPYRIIRINCNTVLNDEQYKYDIFKMKHVIKQVKKKTMSFKVNALNICLDISKKVNVSPTSNIDTISISSINDARDNQQLLNVFPNINQDITNSKGLDLIINTTNDINAKTQKENKLFAKVFSPKKIIVTKLIVIICLIMYLITAIMDGNFLSFSPSILASLGANNILLVKAGELWRILTCAFLHVGLVHFLVNMYSLVVIGSQVENFIGKWRFLFIYMISIVGSSLFSLVFSASNVVSVGASGAIFGLMGSLLYFGYHYRLYLKDAITHQIIPIIIINLLIGFMTTGIDNAAHIGGLIAGYLATMAIGIEGKSKKKDMINGWIVLLLYLVFLCVIVFAVK